MARYLVDEDAFECRELTMWALLVTAAENTFRVARRRFYFQAHLWGVLRGSHEKTFGEMRWTASFWRRKDCSCTERGRDKSGRRTA